MSDADDRLHLCQMILGEIGTRSTITSLSPPDGSPEAFYCNLFFDDTRDTLLRAAHWNCAGRTDTLTLWKALPGTPENPTLPSSSSWSVRYPAPPWLYSYGFPIPAPIQIRRIRAQSFLGDNLFGAIPLYGGANIFSENYNQLPSVRFEVATDDYDPTGRLVINTYTANSLVPAAGGSGYLVGDLIYLYIPPPPDVTGQPARVRVASIDGSGGATAVILLNGGTFSTNTTFQLYQSSTTGNGSGFVGEATFILNINDNFRIILTNARNAMCDFTTSDILVSQWDASFQNAFMSAMEGKLALALIGDKALAKMKLEEANMDILEARVRDGNEGLTQYDHVPDWLQVRGVASMGPSSQWFNPPYGPLFAV